MFTTLPSDPIHYLNMLYYQFGGLLSSGMGIIAIVLIIVCAVIALSKPRIIYLLLLIIVIALVAAHLTGKF